MTIIIILIASIYTLLIVGLIFGCYRIPYFSSQSDIQITKFSIVVPFRNESDNLTNLMTSIKQLDYPRHLFELICIDDQSSDDSRSIIMNNLDYTDIDFRIINNKTTSFSPKKEAINSAIEVSKYNWIVTTDADCLAPTKWLLMLDAFIQEKQPKMVVAPVSYRRPGSFLDGFQLMDFLSLQGATVGGFGLNKPFLCNGANFAYSKQFYNELRGFSGNFEIASGDDIFLLTKAIENDLSSVHYLKSKDAVVNTSPESNLKDLIQQRLRWAAKTTAYKNKFGLFLAVIVALMNVMIIVVFIFCLIGKMKLDLIIEIFSIKLLIDFWLIFKSSQLFEQKRWLTYYFMSSICYPVFTVYISIYAQFSNYKWKGRPYSK